MKKLILFSFISLFSSMLMAQTTDCSNLFFSEYVEGSANNKALEIYNPTDNPVDLSTYVIRRYSNGSPVPTEELTLSGTIQPKDAVVVTNGQTDSVWVGTYWSLPIGDELYGLGDLHCSGDYPTPMYFNGDDAMTLETTTGGVIDIFGKIGQQPENGWNDIPPNYTAGTQYRTSWTEDQTLIRKHTVKTGVTSNPDLFMVNTEWDSIPEDSFDSLGFHRCDCGFMEVSEQPGNAVSLVIYPNPSNGDILNVNVSTGWKKTEILTTTGQIVKSYGQTAGSREGKIDISILDEGIYLVKIYFDDHTSTIQKFIKR